MGGGQSDGFSSRVLFILVCVCVKKCLIQQAKRDEAESCGAFLREYSQFCLAKHKTQGLQERWSVSEVFRCAPESFSTDVKWC